MRSIALKIALVALMTMPITFGCTPAMMHSLATMMGNRATFADTRAWTCEEVVKPASKSALAMGLVEKCASCVNSGPVNQDVTIGKETTSVPPQGRVMQCTSEAWIEPPTTAAQR